MSGDSGVTVVTTLVCSFYLHARLRAHRAPGIPCALCIERRRFHARLGRIAPRDCERAFDVIARSDLSAVAQRAKAEATRQSRILLVVAMECFASLAMT